LQRRLALEEEPGAPRGERAPREPARPLPSHAAVLAMQAGAGNRAVSRWLAGRTLSRSSIAPSQDDPRVPDISDVNAQEREDAADAEAEVGKGAAKINAELSRAMHLVSLLQQQEKAKRAPADEATDDEMSVETPSGSPRDAPMLPEHHAQSGDLDFEIQSDDDATSVSGDDTASSVAELSSVDEQEMSQTPSARLQRATASGDITGAGTGAPGQMLGIPGAQAQPVKNVTIGPRKHPNKRGIRYGPHPNLQGAMDPKYDRGVLDTARRAKLEHSGIGNGTPVRRRPASWATFMSLQQPGRRRWVQGHFINRRLGGEGYMRNLAPFTYSLNGEHYWSVESHILSSVLAQRQDVSYTVQAIDGALGSANEQLALGDHQALLAGSLGKAMSALVQAGLLDPLDAAALLTANPLLDTTATLLTAAAGGPADWAGVKKRAAESIRAYVALAFPLGIVCRARYYTPTGGKTAGQVVIDNTP
jgi:hypothetical protein